MGFYLIAVTWDLQLLWVILQVAIGLGMVIFVHELGHFLVAKLCGVKCEKFYLGFDIYGLKLFRFRWGETEYGIGILPLGGYVKMLGQDDNPARAAQERERAKLQNQDSSDEPTGSGTSGEEALDPRSYMAQSVPERMAIISAGVIMNVIFAFLMAAVAYRLGVRDIECAVGAAFPGEAAWRAGMRPGDEIVQIGDSPPDQQLRFQDIMYAVAFGDIEEGVRFKIKREGVPEPFWLTVQPDPYQAKNRLRPTIGVVPALTTQLSPEQPAIPNSPADRPGKFKGGDKIVDVEGTPVKRYRHVEVQLIRQAEKRLGFDVERKQDVEGKPEEEQPTERINDIAVEPDPLKTLGLVMKLGSITAVQRGSPAAIAEIRPGDEIVAVDGNPPGDPMTLPERLRRRGGETISIKLARTPASGKRDTIEKKVTLRQADWDDPPNAPGLPVSVPALGIAYDVLNTIADIEPDSPAAKATQTKSGRERLRAGDIFVEAEFVPPSDEDRKVDEEFRGELKPVALSAEKRNWPFVIEALQSFQPGTKLKLTTSDGRIYELTPVASKEWFNHERGFMPMVDTFTSQAQTWGEAASLGARETKESLLQVYFFLRKIGTQISPFGLGGPVTIAKVAGGAAYEGPSKLLIFLTMLSANLAVLNFLPIPLLDGGHMVFLILEAILRRPVSEKVVVAFHYAGFLFIIGLMLFVLGLDFGLISRH